MELSRAMIAFFFILTSMRASMANQYAIGGSSGWSPNVQAWSSGRSFEVGDILVFNYDFDADSVIQVSKDDYRSCLSPSPLATYKTGKDIITMNNPGEMFFISGNAQNCMAGQKLHVRVNDDSYGGYGGGGYNPSPGSSASTSLTSSSRIAMLGLIVYVFASSFF